MSVRLHFVVEGQSEESFVNRVLRLHLSQFEVWADARSVYTSRQGPYWTRGGVTKYARIKDDLLRWMRQDRRQDARFTSMLDYYGLPKDFPEWEASKQSASCLDRVNRLERALAGDLNEPRFIPYIQVHEFEALILADPEKLGAMYPSEKNRAGIQQLATLKDRFQNPESINLDDPPSRRIQTAVPEYDKVAAAAQVTMEIGLVTLRASCAHFGEWLEKLEALGGSAPI